MNNNPFVRFKEKHPILANFILVMITMLACLYAGYISLDIFTDHGNQTKVPDVRWKLIDQAIEILEDAGLNYTIDSIYNEDYAPGVVTDQTPNAGSSVKFASPILLTMNCLFPPQVEIPKDITEMAGTDGVTTLKTLGFKHVTTDTVPSDMAGLIIAVKVNGHSVAGGTKAALNAKIVISIGDGSVETIEFDPLGAERDTLIKNKIASGELQVVTDSLGNTRLVPRSKR
ncbi:MAG: PASTA domain-containing protein [Bacteroidales bacterium]|nr:PASTA domain-containing protein [Bacteroidales bacterium]